MDKMQEKKNLLENRHLEDQEEDGEIILKLILENRVIMMRGGLKCLNIVPSVRYQRYSSSSFYNRMFNTLVNEDIKCNSILSAN